MIRMFDFIKRFFKKTDQPKIEKAIKESNEIYASEEPLQIKKQKIISVWEVLNCNEHTQAFHLVSVIPFDVWIDMDEIRRRIWDLFQIEYQNDRSLYPYLKTMVDLGLIETSNIGGKRKWRKRDLLIKIDEEKTEMESEPLKQTA